MLQHLLGSEFRTAVRRLRERTAPYPDVDIVVVMHRCTRPGPLHFKQGVVNRKLCGTKIQKPEIPWLQGTLYCLVLAQLWLLESLQQFHIEKLTYC
jgi:hypothetical protein